MLFNIKKQNLYLKTNSHLNITNNSIKENQLAFLIKILRFYYTIFLKINLFTAIDLLF